MILQVVKVFSSFPGPRRRSDGIHSGEEFREEYLERFYDQAIKNKEKLYIKLDGAWGYAPTFLEEAFAGMVRDGYRGEELLENIVIECSDDHYRQDIEEYIKWQMKYDNLQVDLFRKKLINTIKEGKKLPIHFYGDKEYASLFFKTTFASFIEEGFDIYALTNHLIFFYNEKEELKINFFSSNNNKVLEK